MRQNNRPAGRPLANSLEYYRFRHISLRVPFGELTGAVEVNFWPFSLRSSLRVPFWRAYRRSRGRFLVIFVTGRSFTSKRVRCFFYSRANNLLELHCLEAINDEAAWIGFFLEGSFYGSFRASFEGDSKTRTAQRRPISWVNLRKMGKWEPTLCSAFGRPHDLGPTSIPAPSGRATAFPPEGYAWHAGLFFALCFWIPLLSGSYRTQELWGKRILNSRENGRALSGHESIKTQKNRSPPRPADVFRIF